MPPGYPRSLRLRHSFTHRSASDIYIFKNDGISALKLKHISGIDYESHRTLQVTYNVFET